MAGGTPGLAGALGLIALLAALALGALAYSQPGPSDSIYDNNDDKNDENYYEEKPQVTMQSMQTGIFDGAYIEHAHPPSLPMDFYDMRRVLMLKKLRATHGIYDATDRINEKVGGIGERSSRGLGAHAGLSAELRRARAPRSRPQALPPPPSLPPAPASSASSGPLLSMDPPLEHFWQSYIATAKNEANSFLCSNVLTVFIIRKYTYYLLDPAL